MRDFCCTPEYLVRNSPAGQQLSMSTFRWSKGLDTLVPTGTAAQAMRILQNMEGIHCKGQAMPGQDGMQGRPRCWQGPPGCCKMASRPPSRRKPGQIWWCVSVITALGRPRQEDQDYKVILSYAVNLRPSWATREFVHRNKRENFSEARKVCKCQCPLAVVAA